MNFWATKFISFVAFEQLNRPTPQPGLRSEAARSPAAARSRASSQVAVCRAPSVRTIGSVSRTSPFLIESCSFLPDAGIRPILGGGGGLGYPRVPRGRVRGAGGAGSSSRRPAHPRGSRGGGGKGGGGGLRLRDGHGGQGHRDVEVLAGELHQDGIFRRSRGGVRLAF